MANSAFQSPSPVDWVNVVDYGADPTGTNDSTAAFNAALAALPIGDYSVHVGTVYVPAGSYKIGSGGAGDINHIGPYISMIGAGRIATKLVYYGAGDCLRVYNDLSSVPAATAFGGEFSGFEIEGSNASAGAVGFHAGDMVELKLDLIVKNFNLSGSWGYVFENDYMWTEKVRGRIVSFQNSNAVKCTVSNAHSSTAAASFDYWDLAIQIVGLSGGSLGPQTGVRLENGALMVGGHVRIDGYFTRGSSAGSNPAILTITGQVPSGLPEASNYAGIDQCELEIDAELEDDGSGTHLLSTVYFGDTTNNFLTQCKVNFNFDLGGYAFTASNGGLFECEGLIHGDANLSTWNTFAPATTGVTSPTTNVARYMREGKKITLLVSVAGTSSSTSSTGKAITLPVAAATADVNNIGSLAQVENAGAFPTTPGYALISASTTVTIYRDLSFGAAWTGSGAWSATFLLIYEAAA